MANELMNTFDSGTDIVTRASFNSRIEQANTNFVSGLGEKAEVEPFTGTYLSTGWTGASAPYSQTITVTGMASTDIVYADVALTGTFATDQTILTNYALIYRQVPGTNQATAYATAIPAVNIPMNFIVTR